MEEITMRQLCGLMETDLEKSPSPVEDVVEVLCMIQRVGAKKQAECPKDGTVSILFTRLALDAESLASVLRSRLWIEDDLCVRLTR